MLIFIGIHCAEAPTTGAQTKGGSTLSLTPSILGTISGLPGGAGSDGSSIKGGVGSLSRQLTTIAKDPRTRAKSREFLKQCLQEINYLTSASVLNPLPDRGIDSMVGVPSGQTAPPRPRRTVGDQYIPAVATGHQSEGSTSSLQSQNSYKRSPLGQNSINAGNNAQGAEGEARSRALASRAPFGGGQEPLIEANESSGEGEGPPFEQPNPTIEIGKSTSPPPSLTADAAPFDAPPKSPAMGTTPLPNGGGLDPFVSDRDASGTGGWASTLSADSADGRFSNAPGSIGSSSGSSGGFSSGSSPASSTTTEAAGEDEHESEQVTAIFRPGAGGADEAEWKKLKEAAQRERQKRERTKYGGAAVTSQMTLAGDKAEQARKAAAGGHLHDDDLANLTLTHEEESTGSKASTEAADAQLWKSKRVLRR